MTRLQAEIVPIGGTLARPVANANSAWHERRGLLLRLFDERGRLGQGEASPLPGFSADDLRGCQAVLGPFARRPLELDLERPLGALLAQAIGTLPPEQAAARFAVETALLDLVGQRREAPLWVLIRELSGTEGVPAALPLCSLIDVTSADDALRSAQLAVERGVGTLKLKVGRPGAEAIELGIARALRAALGAKLRLRFDANRAYAREHARARLEALAELDPEFVEEPLEPESLAALGRSPVPLALDESLRDADWLELEGPELVQLGLTAVVLKPMLLGGFTRCLALAARAKSLGLRVVVSHLFDGPVALAATAALGLATASSDCASGLDRHPGLEGWQRAELPMISRSQVLPWEAPGLGLLPLAGGPS